MGGTRPSISSQRYETMLRLDRGLVPAAVARWAAMTSSNGRLQVAVAGSTGYIGMQCVALAAAHPHLQLTRVLARSTAGQRYSDAVPGSGVDLVIDPGDDAGAA